MNEEHKGGVHVEFVNIAQPDKKATAKEGRPIFKDVEHVHIRWVGDNKKELYAPANDKTMFSREHSRYLTWAEVYPEHYRVFKLQGDQNAINGTPLSELPFLTEAKRAELRAANVLTAEGLAGMDGTLLQRLGMGARDLKNQAQEYINAAAKFAERSEMREQSDALRAENEALKARMARLESLLERNDVIGSDIRAAAVQDRAAKASEPSPFADWDDDTIRLWIEEQGGEKPHHKCSHDTLVAKADELNAELKRKAA